MTRRRDLIVGGACLATSAVAFALTPRRRVSLMPGGRLDAVAPPSLGTWQGRDVSDLAPASEGGLEGRIYDQTLERVYVDAATGVEIMMLLAHGDTQSTELQLHRPETCYPAFGFAIAASRASLLPLAAGAPLPVRELVAQAPGRRENVIYWTRLGEYLPTSENQQRLDRVKIALSGIVTDGLLARFSVIDQDFEQAFAHLRDFIPSFVRAVAPVSRPALVGTALSRELARAGG